MAKPKKDDKKKKGAVNDEEKAAKRKARMEALKNRPEGQRTNSKQVDIIELDGGSKVLAFAYPVRKTGTLVQSVLVDEKGKAISVSSQFVPGTKAKSKKGHGTIVPGVAGVGKNKNEEEDED